MTQHAEEQITERKLERAWVERVALRPEWTSQDPRPGIARHLGVVPQCGGRVLRVAVADDAGGRRVLSAHFGRDARRP